MYTSSVQDLKMSFKKTKSNGICHEEKEGKSHIHTALPQVIAVSIKNVLLLGYGMTLGFPTIVIPTLQGGVSTESLVLNSDQISWISSINLICVPLGCLFSGILTQPIGRKKSMQLVNLPFLAAWLLFHFSTSVEHLYFALCLSGLGGGLLEAPVITYVAEITQPHLRGMLSATSSMTIIFGVFVQFLLGTFLYWRTVALVNLAIPVLAVFLLFFVPESPHWLIMKNKHEEAKKALAWLRGWTTTDQIQSEYKELYHAIHVDGNDDNNTSGKMQHKTKSLYKKFFTKTFIIPYILVCFSFFLGHFSGMTTLQTFAVPIFQTLKAPIDKYYATLVLGIVELIGSLLCVIAVHYTGKRPLTFISTIGCGICFCIVATYAYLLNVHDLVVNNKNVSDGGNLTTTTTDMNTVFVFGIEMNAQLLQWLPMTLLIGSALMSHLGIRLLPWVLIGEVYPADIRSIASGLSGGMGYIFGFAANKLFLTMIHHLTLPGTFWIYGFLSLFGTVILYFFLPETEGRTLIDIEHHFSGIKRIHKSAGVYKNQKLNDIEIGQINQAYTSDIHFENNAESKL